MARKKICIGICFLFAVFALLLSGCPSGGGEVAVTGIVLNKTALSLAVGEEVNLIATVTPYNADNKNVSWVSSDTAIATINDGTVRAIALGTAEITATTEDGNKSATCSVTVEWTPVTNFSEIKGTWEGSSFITIPDTGNFDYTVRVTIDDTDAEMELTIDFENYLRTMLGSEFVLMGPLAWEMIKANYDELLPEMDQMGLLPEGSEYDISFTDGYKIIITGSSLLEADTPIEGNVVFINVNKDKLRVIFEDDEDDITMQELILDKQ
jgi:hypothetical protein